MVDGSQQIVFSYLFYGVRLQKFYDQTTNEDGERLQQIYDYLRPWLPPLSLSLVHPQYHRNTFDFRSGIIEKFYDIEKSSSCKKLALSKRADLS